MKWTINENYPFRDQLLQVMIDNEWSDMYITAWTFPAIKIWWEIVKINEWIEKFEWVETQNFAYSIITQKQHEDLLRTKNLDFAFTFSARRFRANVSFQQWKYMTVIRLLWNKIPSLWDLKLPDVYREITKLWQGLILVTWPTWSWKSTTLAAMIDNINANYNKHIITIEDPVEYIHPHKSSIVEQKEIWRDVPDYKTALIWAMRQNPQVILFWEMRSGEEIEMALTLAETGHLVFSTLHTKSAYQTISRIIDAFPWDRQNQIRLQLAESLAWVFSQRLLKKQDWSWVIAVKEILINNTAVSNLIRENDLHQMPSVIQMWNNEWMQMLEKDIVDAINKSQITLEEWLKFANNPKYIKDNVIL